MAKLRDFMPRNEATASENPSQPAAPAPARTTRVSGPASCIDETSELEGTLRCKDTIRVAGRLKGKLECQQTVVIAESAVVHASIEADAVVVSGQVKGDVAARRKITLEKTARVTGDLQTPGIVIEEGARLEGRIVIGSEAGSAPKEKAAKPAKQAASSASNASAKQPAAPAAP